MTTPNEAVLATMRQRHARQAALMHQFHTVGMAYLEAGRTDLAAVCANTARRFCDKARAYADIIEEMEADMEAAK